MIPPHSSWTRLVPAARPQQAGAPGVVRALPFEGDDAALVEALQKGHSGAAAAFYNRHIKGVHRLVSRLLGPDTELEDVVHDVFVRALESLSALRDPAALQSWVLGIAVKTAKIRIQRRMRGRWLRFLPPDDLPEMPVLPQGGLGEALHDVYVILNELPADERIAIVLHRIEGLSHEEAAAASGMSVATFRRRFARAESKFLARATRQPSLVPWLGGDVDAE